MEIKQEALELYRYHERMQLFNEAYSKLRLDEKASKNELKEREELVGTLGDGIDNE